MTKAKKFWLVFGTIMMVLHLTGGAFGIMLIFYNPFLAPRMANFYSNNENYHQYRAAIRDYSKTTIGLLTIESIFSLEDEEPIAKINFIQAQVFSTDINSVWCDFDPQIGMVFEFTGTLRVFFDGCPAAIVSIAVEGKEILPFEDGKTAVLAWAKTIY